MAEIKNPERKIVGIKFRFKDEWILKAAHLIPAVGPDTIELFRREQKPYLAEALIKARIAAPKVIGHAITDAFNIGFVENTCACRRLSTLSAIIHMPTPSWLT